MRDWLNNTEFALIYMYFAFVIILKQGQPLIDWDQPVEVGGEIRAAVPINEFAKHVAELHADGDIGFSKEYEAIQNESINEEYPSEHSQHPDNKQKNRYLNIIACEYFDVELVVCAWHACAIRLVDSIRQGF